MKIICEFQMVVYLVFILQVEIKQYLFESSDCIRFIICYIIYLRERMGEFCCRYICKKLVNVSYVVIVELFIVVIVFMNEQVGCVEVFEVNFEEGRVFVFVVSKVVVDGDYILIQVVCSREMFCIQVDIIKFVFKENRRELFVERIVVVMNDCCVYSQFVGLVVIENRV